MDLLISDIELVQAILDVDPEFRSETDSIIVKNMIMRFARFLSSPSQLNALSVLKSNSAEKLAEWLTNEEEAMKKKYENFRI